MFAKQLVLLEQQAPNEKTRTSLASVERIRGDFEPIASGPVNQQGIQLLLSIDDELLGATHEVVLRLQEHSGTAPAKLVNTAGRQRMLSQRIAKLYILASSGMQDAVLSDQLQSACDEFEDAQTHLKQAPENTPEIQQGLAEVDRQWIIFRASVKLSEGKYVPFMVARAAEKIFKQMDQITALYVRLNQRNWCDVYCAGW